LKAGQVVDTGPLVALFDKGDTYHQAAQEFVRKNRFPMFTTLAVVTEVEYLLDFSIHAQADFLEWLVRGSLYIVSIEREELAKIKALMEKFRDLPMDFADATLVAACEKLGTPRIATVDKDFQVYRYFGKKKFSLAPGFGLH